jgi:hypothetical protein
MNQDYLGLLQGVAIIGVACVLLLTAAAEIYAVEGNGNEPSDVEGVVGPPKFKTKYIGKVAFWTRWSVLGVGLLLACVYSAVILFLLFDLTFMTGNSLFYVVKLGFIGGISFTLLVSCWVSFFMIQLRIQYLRERGLNL